MSKYQGSHLSSLYQIERIVIIIGAHFDNDKLRFKDPIYLICIKLEE